MIHYESKIHFYLLHFYIWKWKFTFDCVLDARSYESVMYALIGEYEYEEGKEPIKPTDHVDVFLNEVLNKRMKMPFKPPYMMV